MSLKRRQFLYLSGAVFISSFAKPFNLLSRSLRDKSLYFSSGADLKNKYFFSALNYTGLELGVWTNSITSNITWDMPGTINHQEYCILLV